eukprot:TRINITY_DN10458_c0_g1_i1.p1 TRINITY_DN10458_c0_g1~~TRINITY_DN10458_c0_g1_i1.p1  ORF type:complete len:320 (-),score=50.92 TRINITY_DN10458_c0_g1_i1:84-1043(-)
MLLLGGDDTVFKTEQITKVDKMRVGRDFDPPRMKNSNNTFQRLNEDSGSLSSISGFGFNGMASTQDKKSATSKKPTIDLIAADYQRSLAEKKLGITKPLVPQPNSGQERKLEAASVAKPDLQLSKGRNDLTVSREAIKHYKAPESKVPQPAERRHANIGIDERGQHKTKKALVLDVLIRWWYCMPDWPPVDYDYGPSLKQRRLRKLDAVAFKHEPIYDHEGYEKVIELSAYRGLFKNVKGEIFDLRPQDSCPSINNLMKKDMRALYAYLATGLRKQMEDLKQYEPKNLVLLRDLQTQYASASRQLEIYTRREASIPKKV